MLFPKAIDSDEITAFERERDRLSLIRRLFRRDGAAIAALGDDLAFLEHQQFQYRQFSHRKIQRLIIARSLVELHGGKIWVESDGYDEKRLSGSSFYGACSLTGQSAGWPAAGAGPLSQR